MQRHPRVFSFLSGLRLTFVFSVIRLVSRRCHTISAIPIIGTPWRSPWVRIATFVPHPPHLLTIPPDGYGLCFDTQARPEIGSLLCGSCSSNRDFASGFLKTLPRRKRPCLRLAVSTIRTCKGLSPSSSYPCQAHVNHPAHRAGHL